MAHVCAVCDHKPFTTLKGYRWHMENIHGTKHKYAKRKGKATAEEKRMQRELEASRKGSPKLRKYLRDHGLKRFPITLVFRPALPPAERDKLADDIVNAFCETSRGDFKWVFSDTGGGESAVGFMYTGPPIRDAQRVASAQMSGKTKVYVQFD